MISPYYDFTDIKNLINQRLVPILGVMVSLKKNPKSNSELSVDKFIEKNFARNELKQVLYSVNDLIMNQEKFHEAD